jgi:hypothetical protein
LRSHLLHLRGAHTVDEHAGKNASRGVNYAHLHGLRNLLLVAAVVLGDILGGLDAVRFRFHDLASPERIVRAKPGETGTKSL